MDSDPKGRRRRVGVLMLIGASLMLIAGETVLKNRLSNAVFLLYWLLCLVLTGGAIVVAYLDVRAVQQRGRREARELLETTLTQIERDARKRPTRPSQPQP
jgi:hypothetical protein